MCGLVGIAGKLEFRDESLMKRLLLFDYFRGTDSTGFASLNRNNGDTSVVKIASSPIDLFDMKKFNTALTGATSSVFLGHNRATTIGKTNNVNAHPFEFDHIIGAHNGTLTQKSWRALETLIGEQTEVDSIALIKAIAKVGIEETVKHLQGAWALTWIDTKEKTINFLRNPERPFWLSYAADFTKIIWASQHPMIAAAIKLAPSQHKEQEIYTDKDNYGYFSTQENIWYRFDLDDLVSGKYKTKPNGKVKELKGLAPEPKAVHTYASHSNYSYMGGEYNSPFKKEASPPNGIGMETIIDPVGGPFDCYLSPQQFKRMAEDGCSWCSAPVDITDKGLTVYSDHDKILCSSCGGHHDTDNRIYVNLA